MPCRPAPASPRTPLLAGSAPTRRPPRPPGPFRRSPSLRPPASLVHHPLLSPSRCPRTHTFLSLTRTPPARWAGGTHPASRDLSLSLDRMQQPRGWRGRGWPGPTASRPETPRGPSFRLPPATVDSKLSPPPAASGRPAPRRAEEGGGGGEEEVSPPPLSLSLSHPPRAPARLAPAGALRPSHTPQTRVAAASSRTMSHSLPPSPLAGGPEGQPEPYSDPCAHRAPLAPPAEQRPPFQQPRAPSRPCGFVLRVECRPAAASLPPLSFSPPALPSTATARKGTNGPDPPFCARPHTPLGSPPPPRTRPPPRPLPEGKGRGRGERERERGRDACAHTPSPVAIKPPGVFVGPPFPPMFRAAGSAGWRGQDSSVSPGAPIGGRRRAESGGCT